MTDIRKKSFWEIGTIESLSPQGEKLYAIIRRRGDLAKDAEGNNVLINTYLFGNLHNIPEAILTLSEVLIPIDIDLSISKVNLDTLMNRGVAVFIENGMPKYAKLMDDSSARIIEAEDIAIARQLSVDPSKIDKNGIVFLQKKGYILSQIEATIAESIGANSTNGKTLKYGDQSTYDAVSKSEQALRYDMTSSLPIATNIPASQLKNKTCHIQINAFSAK